MPDLRELANNAGNESYYVAQRLLRQALNALTLSRTPDTNQYLAYLNVCGKISEDEYRLLRELAKTLRECDFDSARRICAELRQNGIGPVACAIGSVLEYWHWHFPRASLEGRADQLDARFRERLIDAEVDPCCVDGFVSDSIFEAAIKGAATSASDSASAVQGAINEVASFLVEGESSNTYRWHKWIVEAVRAVARIGNGFYVEQLLAHFTRKQLEDALSTAPVVVAEYIKQHLERCSGAHDLGERYAISMFGIWVCECLEAEILERYEEVADDVARHEVSQWCVRKESGDFEPSYWFSLDNVRSVLEVLIVAVTRSSQKAFAILLAVLEKWYYARDHYLSTLR